MSSLGRKIQHYRERSGLTLRELADRSGVSRTVLSRLETGERDDLKVSSFRKIAQALGRSLDDFFDVKTKNKKVGGDNEERLL